MSAPSAARLETDVLAALPIFPLRDAVLLPRSLLPLHVFEPRYLAMTRDVLAGKGFMAIARLLPGFEPGTHERPPVAPTIGIGRVVAASPTDGGEVDILLAGVARAVIERELPPTRVYREVEARVINDRPGADAAGLRDQVAQLVVICDRLADVLPAGGDELRQLARIDADASASADRVSGLLVTDADRRQALLEEPDPLIRATAIVEHASQLLAALSRPRTGPPN
jgi:Lon protease-like protein